MEKATNHIANLVRENRQKFGLSQEQLAILTSCDTSTLSRIERGVADPSYHILKRLKEVLNLSGESLFQKKYYGFKGEFGRCLKASNIYIHDQLIGFPSRAHYKKYREVFEEIKEIPKNKEVKEIFETLEKYVKNEAYEEYVLKGVAAMEEWYERYKEEGSDARPNMQKEGKWKNDQPKIDKSKIESYLSSMQIGFLESGFEWNKNIKTGLQNTYDLIPED